ncbi:unnamed protein product [Discula destructiva]
MHTSSHALIGAASAIPVPPSEPILSISPIVLSTPDRLVNLELKATVPTTGLLPPNNPPLPRPRPKQLPLLPRRLRSPRRVLGLPTASPSSSQRTSAPSSSACRRRQARKLFYQDRAEDMVRILDPPRHHRGRCPGPGRTASMLLGTSNTDPRDGTATWHKPEPRIKAGVILAGLGSAADLSEFLGGRALIPFYGADFGSMTTPALVVYGDEDVGPHLTVRGADWHADPYVCWRRGRRICVTMKGARHGLGGVSGWDTAEAVDDESPERLAIVQRMTWAWLSSRLSGDDGAWEGACKAFEGLEGQGTVESNK